MKTLLTEEQKAKYWANRRAGKRGQDPLPEPVMASNPDGSPRVSDVEMKMTKHGLQANPRYERRRKAVNRQYTKKGYTQLIHSNGEVVGPVKKNGKLHNIFRHIQRRIERQQKQQALGVQA